MSAINLLWVQWNLNYCIAHKVKSGKSLVRVVTETTVCNLHIFKLRLNIVIYGEVGITQSVIAPAFSSSLCGKDGFILPYIEKCYHLGGCCHPFNNRIEWQMVQFTYLPLAIYYLRATIAIRFAVFSSAPEYVCQIFCLCCRECGCVDFSWVLHLALKYNLCIRICYLD